MYSDEPPCALTETQLPDPANLDGIPTAASCKPLPNSERTYHVLSSLVQSFKLSGTPSPQVWELAGSQKYRPAPARRSHLERLVVKPNRKQSLQKSLPRLALPYRSRQEPGAFKADEQKYVVEKLDWHNRLETNMQYCARRTSYNPFEKHIEARRAAVAALY